MKRIPMEKTYKKHISTPKHNSIDKKNLEQQQAYIHQKPFNNKLKGIEIPSKEYLKKDSFNNQSIQTDQQQALITELCAMDKKIALLLAKRIQIYNNLQGVNPKNHEKILRKSWEDFVQGFSKDHKFVHQLFILLQHLEISHDSLQNMLAFSLKPKQLPINIDLELPSCLYTTKLYLALAVCSGSEGTFHNIVINTPIIECIKTLKQMGAELIWEKTGTILCKKPLPPKTQYKQPIDKVIHVGDDNLLLYLLIFLAVLRPARIKFIGNISLKLTDFSLLRNFLPQLGARLTNTIHGQDGLPLRIEASAILPEVIHLPKDFPVDAAIALFVTLAGWDKKVTVYINKHPEAEKIMQTVVPILTACTIPIQITSQDNMSMSLQVTPATASIQNISTDTYAPPAAALLALPLFTGGTITLKKKPHQTTHNLQPMLHILKQTGLTITESDSHITSKQEQSKPFNITDLSNIHDELFPLAFTVALIPIIKNQNNQLPKLPQTIKRAVLESYLERLGLRLFDKKIVVGEKNTLPWISPSISWSLAFSLAAFLCSDLKLSNPESVETYFPQYWKIYNTLPFMQNKPQPPETPPETTITTILPRRRIITKKSSTLIAPLLSEKTSENNLI